MSEFADISTKDLDERDSAEIIRTKVEDFLNRTSDDSYIEIIPEDESPSTASFFEQFTHADAYAEYTLFDQTGSVETAAEYRSSTYNRINLCRQYGKALKLYRKHYEKVSILSKSDNMPNLQSTDPIDTLTSSLQKTSFSKLYVPNDRPFTKSVQECSNFSRHSSSCKNLVDADIVTQQAFEIVKKEINECNKTDSDNGYRKPPLLFSRMARGGKTTTLRLLFDQLKESGYDVMIISFNGDFRRQPNESQTNAILRMIAAQLVECDGSEIPNIECDRASLEAYLPHEKFVLLVDEINQLGYLDDEAGLLIRQMFLDRKGRYIVLSTHVPLQVDGPCSEAIGGGQSKRGFLTVPLPTTTDMTKIHGMAADCASVTPLQAVWLGGIPSLIYSTHYKKEDSPAQRFLKEMISIKVGKELELFTSFTFEFMTGSRCNEDLKIFDMFSTVHMEGLFSWPLCYMKCIIKLFESHRDCSTYVDPILKCLKAVEAYAKTTKSGKDWEVIVAIGILFQFINNKFRNSTVPFDLMVGDVPQVDEVKYIDIPHDVKYGDVKHFIDTQVNQKTNPTLFLFVPVDNTFYYFDGFAVYSCLRPVRFTQIAGYQVKKKKQSSVTQTAVPMWMNCEAWFVSGNAADLSEERNNWHIMSKDEICKNILGYSLSHVYPDGNW